MELMEMSHRAEDVRPLYDHQQPSFDEDEDEDVEDEEEDEMGSSSYDAAGSELEEREEEVDSGEGGKPSLSNGQANGQKSRDEISSSSSSPATDAGGASAARRGSAAGHAAVNGASAQLGPQSPSATAATTRRTTATAAMAGSKWAMGLPPKTIKKRKKRSACHAWTSETRASEIVREFAQDRTSAVFYLFRRIASGGMGKHLRIMPAKRNPPKYSCFFEELGMIADPDGDSHYHVWAWPAPGSAASDFMSTYVGATELEGVELGGATSDEEDNAVPAATTAPKEKPKRGRKRKESGSPNGVEANCKTNKTARVEIAKNETTDMKSQSVCSDDSSEVELEIEYDDDDIEGAQQSNGAYHGAKLDTMKQERRKGEDLLLDSKQATTRQEEQRPSPLRYGNGSAAGSSLPPQPIGDERSNGYHPHSVPSATLPHLGDDHLAHLYSDLEAAEHLSLDEVLEHPALFGPDVVGTSTALSGMGFGNTEELLHTFLLQELDLDSVTIDFRKRLTARSGESSNRAWSVYSGVWQGCHEVAVKVYHEERIYQTECHNLWRCNHPNILHAYGRIYAIPGRDIQGCIVLERASLGDLHSWMIDNQKYLHDTQFVRHFLEAMKGIASAISYLHSLSPALVHGDLKPSNILLFGHKIELTGTPHYFGLRAKLSDVGVAHTPSSTGRGRDSKSLGLWQSPEQRANPAASYFDASTDVFSFGLILWAFWTKNVTLTQLKRALPLSDNERPSIPKECPAQWASIIKRCWAANVQDRLSSRTLLEELSRVHS